MAVPAHNSPQNRRNYPGEWPRFAFQPSVDERLIRELSTGNFIAHGENVLIFGPPGVGKSHLAIGLGRKIVEQGHTVRFTTATALLASPGESRNGRRTL